MIQWHCASTAIPAPPSAPALAIRRRWGLCRQLIGADDDAAAADCKSSYKYYVAYKLIEDSGSGKESRDRHE